MLMPWMISSNFEKVANFRNTSSIKLRNTGKCLSLGSLEVFATNHPLLSTPDVGEAYEKALISIHAGRVYTINAYLRTTNT
jgi:hypothetical protein